MPQALPAPVNALRCSPWPSIRPLSEYGLIIDARTPSEFAEDHILGAVNLPVVNQQQYAEVGTLHRSDTHTAYTNGVRYALVNMAEMLPSVYTSVAPDAPLLVYCFRGGKRSALWADTLRTVGFEVQVIPGGWKSYRRWINEQLLSLPTRFTYKVLYGATGCGKTRLLAALERKGAQVLDLEHLANHRGSLIGSVPGLEQPPQKAFDSLLVTKLTNFDPARPVWIESESRRIGQRQIPIPLHQAMRAESSTIYSISMSMEQRVILWKEDYAHHATNPDRMVESLRPIRPIVGGEEFALWEQLARDRSIDTLFERVMANHYDPTYSRSLTGHFKQHLHRMLPIELQSCSHEELDRVADSLLAQP